MIKLSLEKNMTLIGVVWIAKKKKKNQRWVMLQLQAMVFDYIKVVNEFKKYKIFKREKKRELGFYKKKI